MIVWINGPFGVGKTTVAEALVARRPEATLFDPELLGFLVRTWQPKGVAVDDFQDLSVWRRLVVESAVGLVRDFGRSLVVPMTLLNPAYFDEIVGGIRDAGLRVEHFCLVASRNEVMSRVANRGDGGDWFPRKYDEYSTAFADARFGRFVETGARTAADVAAEILVSLPPSG